MLKLIIGTMRSGKSTHLLNELIKLQSSNKKVVVIKPQCDTRDFFARGIDKKIAFENEYFLFNECLDNYDYILIDETQFLNNKQINRIIYLSENKNVYCYGLSSKAVNNNQVEIWESIAKLIPFAETIEKLNSYCSHCKNVGLIHLRQGEVISDDYDVLCFKCYKKLRL